MQSVTVSELRATHNAYVVDVREPAEFVAGHVPDARPVPLSTVPSAVPGLPTDQPVYVICEVGARSAQAVMFLARCGLDARNIAGGTRAWVAAGYPLEH